MFDSFLKYSLLITCLTSTCFRIVAQDYPVVKFVNPLIGTTRTKTSTQWGSEGGTYPGAVAPYGFVQLTPETKVTDSKGYDYCDSTICWFSCVNHMSGYPNGSAGRIKVMPLGNDLNFQPLKKGRPFSHTNEKAEAGYYRVLFSDDGTVAEATASVRTGMFRFTFPQKSKPKLFLGELGKTETPSRSTIKGSLLNTLISFNIDYLSKEAVPGGWIVTFPSVETGENRLILKIGTSTVDNNSTVLNLQKEAATWDFDRFKSNNQAKWEEALSVIGIDDQSLENKTIFYTALYDSMLIPWIISDVNGAYKGADDLIHQTKGDNQYSAFSPWDTFRSLHPLLCLIAPDRQRDMIHSMLDQYKQTGRLPKGPMTGNHVLAIIVDSYLKGIRDLDSTLVYKAMKDCLTSASKTKAFSEYTKLGYVPYSYSESVTQTVEYAYNDWAVAQFAQKVMGDENEYRQLLERSYSYRNLFSAEKLALLPRQGKHFIVEPGNFGYKEGDPWSYSLFVPHNPRDLINLMGGDQEFSNQLDSSLLTEKIFFDNEPVLHVPYLFNDSHRPDLTQKWVRSLMKSHYTNSPYGLPGNDDLGSMSSWFVFSAMGFFPVCPGRPAYDLGSPLFKKVTLHLKNGKKLSIKSLNNSDDHCYVKSVSLNGSEYNRLSISHSTFLKGGELIFTMDKTPMTPSKSSNDFGESSEIQKLPDFVITGFNFLKNKVTPDQPFYVYFTLKNSGSKGTKIVRLSVDGQEVGKKNLLVNENSIRYDSIECRLYPVGRHLLNIDNLDGKEIEVVPPAEGGKTAIEVTELNCRVISGKNQPIGFYYLVKNKGGFRDSSTISVLADGTDYQKSVTLLPGEVKKITSSVVFKSDGLHQLKVGSKVKFLKIYTKNTDSKIVDINSGHRLKGDTIQDQSGLGNHGMIHSIGDLVNPPTPSFKMGSESYVEFFPTECLNSLQDKITIMAWIKPTGETRGLADIITKGDFIALQADGNRSLSWFAGGWGRGTCSATLPENWLNTWHHVAGVSDGKSLKLYIDGVESASLNTGFPVNLSTPARWMIGRNEEFPGERYFYGFVDHFKIFVEPLSGSEIKIEMMKRVQMPNE
jgi:putative alpha-1,2-mannosidase